MTTEPKLAELIDDVERHQRQLTEDRLTLDRARSALNRTEALLHNAQNALGARLQKASVIGGDYALMQVDQVSEVVRHG